LVAAVGLAGKVGAVGLPIDGHLLAERPRTGTIHSGTGVHQAIETTRQKASKSGGRAVHIAYTVENNSALQATASTQYRSITRRGFVTPGDGGGAIYIASNSPCRLNSGNGDGGSEVKSADGKCWLADFRGGPASIKAFGAKADGLANDSKPLDACLTLSASSNIACRIPAGAIISAEDVVLPSNASLIGDGTLASKIRRLAGSSSSAGILHCTFCSNVTISDVTIEGNKTNETVTSNNLNFSGYTSITIRRVAISGAKGGHGITLDNSNDKASSSSSSLSDSEIFLNDGSGILVTTAAWKLSVRNVFANANGQYGFYAGPSGVTNNRPNVLQFISIEGGEYSGNGNSGIAGQGYIAGYLGNDPAQPIYGAGIWPVTEMSIRDVRANENGAYGIVYQVNGGLLSDSIASGNNTSEINGAGVLANCFSCQVKDIVAEHNGVKTGFGIDAGCAIRAHLRGGRVNNNVVGINIGCSQCSDIREVSISNNTAAAITAYAVEASGDGFGISGFTDMLSIIDKILVCPAIGSTYGILTQDGGTNIEIRENSIHGCDPIHALVSDLYSGRVEKNRLIQSEFNSVDINMNEAKDPLIIPDGIDGVVRLTGAASFSHIYRYSQNIVGSGIGGIRVDVAGSSYMSGDTAAITGCSVNPAGVKAFADRSGRLTGVRLGTHGSDCKNPIAHFRHGTGGALTFMIGSWYNTRSELRLLVGTDASLTISEGGNTSLQRPVRNAGPTA
jgi:hypothetical protein